MILMPEVTRCGDAQNNQHEDIRGSLLEYSNLCILNTRAQTYLHKRIHMY